jgi:trimeric autotransporter adhesin
MKINYYKAGLVLLFSCGVIAWNTTNSEDLLMGSGNTGTTTVGQSGVIGSYNVVTGRSLMVVGDSNKVGEGAETTADELKWSLVVGTGNTVKKGTAGRGRNIVAGDSNTVDGTNCLVAGFNNTLAAPTVGTICYQSSAIGNANQVNTKLGWAIGQQNEVTGLRGVAIGMGSNANNTDSMALGRWNLPMEPNDVVVIGTGTSETVNNTALRATADGSVILGSATSGIVVLAKAQGDISMGIYTD